MKPPQDTEEGAKNAIKQFNRQIQAISDVCVLSPPVFSLSHLMHLSHSFSQCYEKILVRADGARDPHALFADVKNAIDRACDF